MEIIIVIILVIILVGIEVAGIWYVNKINSKPDEDFKDWDVTVVDGLDELEEEEQADFSKYLLEKLNDDFAIGFAEWIIKGKIDKKYLEIYKKERGL
jgi:hypothetical protein